MRWPTLLGFAIVGLISAIGTYWAFERGANDFRVFYAVWNAVVSQKSIQIYHVSHDRFLYAPGFAFLMSPFGILSANAALAVWCFLKAAALGFIIREISKYAGWAAALWGTIIVARPLLIDFQYGQVNLFILAACVFALSTHFNTRSSATKNVFAWLLLAIAAVSKIFALPLLLVPFLTLDQTPFTKRKSEWTGILLGVFLIAIVPVFFVGWEGWIRLAWDWRDALIGRSLPEESHNQSFAAFLLHYLSGKPTHIIALGPPPGIPLGHALLTENAVHLLSLGWTAITSAFILVWIFLTKPQTNRLKWISVLIAMIILPSHLVWKPYFVMSLPLAAMAIHSLETRGEFQYPSWKTLFLLLTFAAFNLTGFDFIGYDWAGKLEAASIFMLSHLVLMALVLAPDKKSPLIH